MAYKLLAEINHDLNAKLPMSQARYDYASAVLSYEEGKYRAAVEQFQKAFRPLPPNNSPFLPYAVSLLKIGEVDNAITQLKRLAQWYPFSGGTFNLPNQPLSDRYWPISSVKAHYWLGVAYEQQGDKQKAAKEYEKFVNIWAEADFKSVELQDAKLRLARLKGVAIK